MQRNVGGVDRGVRIIVGAALVLWALTTAGPYHWWGLAGLVPLVTGLVGWCPAYVPFGWKTCRPR